MGMKQKIRCYNDSPSSFDERLVREQRTMSNVALFCGVDYHQDQLQVCLLDASARQVLNRGVVNDVEEVARLLRGAGGDVKAVAIEACCGAATFGEQLAVCGPWRVELAHPGYVAR